MSYDSLIALCYMRYLEGIQPREMTAQIDSGTVREQLSRILASPPFKQSDRLCRFLRYIVEEALAGRGDRIKEYMIGVEVCGRKEAYDPRVDSVVRVEAIRLRSKLREYYVNFGAGDPVVIEVPKGAYIPVFRERGSAPIAEDPAPPTKGYRAIKGYRAWIPAAIAVVSVAVLLLVYFAFRPPHPPASRPWRIAVLPFQSFGSGEDVEAYSQGLADSVMTDLAKVHGIEVIARNSVMAFKGKTVRAQELGQRLSADYLLEGSLQKTGGGYHVTARLIRTSDEGSVWAADYESAWKDVVSMEKRLSESVARQLKDALSPADIAAIGRTMTTSAEAYDAVLKGRHNSLQYFYNGNEKYYAAAESLLSTAVARDPQYANAAVELALLYGRRYQNNGDVVWRDKAEALFRRALELDPCHATANALMCSIVRDRGDFDRSIEYGRKAVACDSESAQAHNALGLTYLGMGFYESADVEFRHSIDADALFVSPYINRFETLRAERQPKEALLQARRAAEIEPRSPWTLFALGAANLDAGDVKGAVQAWHDAVQFIPPDHEAVRQVAAAFGDVALGNTERAKAVVQHWAGRPEWRSVLWEHMFSDLCVAAADAKMALRCVNEALEYHDYRRLLTDPALTRFRGDPEFERILKERRQRWDRDVATYASSLPAPPPRL